MRAITKYCKNLPKFDNMHAYHDHFVCVSANVHFCKRIMRLSPPRVHMCFCAFPSDGHKSLARRCLLVMIGFMTLMSLILSMSKRQLNAVQKPLSIISPIGDLLQFENGIWFTIYTVKVFHKNVSNLTFRFFCLHRMVDLAGWIANRYRFTVFWGSFLLVLVIGTFFRNWFRAFCVQNSSFTFPNCTGGGH